MTIRYCDCDLGTGANDGTTWENAFQTFQAAADAAVAGDVVYCKGTDTLGATVDIDTNAGTNAGGFIKFIGCNASGDVDGTRFVLDANGGSHHVVTWVGMDLIWWENFEVKNTGTGTYDGVSMTATSSGCVFVNCSFHNVGRHGFNAATGDVGCLYYRCAFYLNGSSGHSSCDARAKFVACSFHDNTGDGATVFAGVAIGCLSYDNGDDGFDVVDNGFLFECSVDGNDDDGIYREASSGLYALIVLSCRITNHSGVGDIGLNLNTEPTVYGFNFLDNNADHYSGESLASFIPATGTGTTSDSAVNENGAGGGDTNQGYTDLTDGAEDFNLRSDATLRRTAITVPLT